MEIEKNGEFKNVRLNTIPLGESVVVEKIFDEGLKIETKFGFAYNHKFKYNGEEVSTLMSETQNKEFEKFKKGDNINIKRVAKEALFNTKDGKKVSRVIGVYEFEKVGGETSSTPTQPEFGGEEVVLDDVQLSIVKYMIDNNLSGDAEIKYKGQVKKIKDVLPTEVLKNPKKYQ